MKLQRFPVPAAITLRPEPQWVTSMWKSVQPVTPFSRENKSSWIQPVVLKNIAASINWKINNFQIRSIKVI